jgi:C4-dicarboxylate-specific signal transduction histidine kinase
VELELIDFATHLGTIALERSIVEAEAEEQRSELAHLGRVAVLGGLSGALAHELSQPLASILSDAQAGQRFLARNPPDVKEVREILNDIVTAHQRAGMVIDRLRGLLSKRHGEFSPLDMNNVVGETLQLLRGDLADRQVSASTELDPELALVLGDRVQLIQVLINLIMNACEAMSSTPPPERQIKILTSGSSGEPVRVSVVDRGVGIPEELMRRIGEPFLTSKPQGLGLGLSISRTILVAHGGGLRLENNADQGATFHLVLPAAEPSL